MAFGALAAACPERASGPPSTAPVATVTVAPGNDTVLIAGTQLFTATLKDSAGRVLTNRTITWSTGNGAVASVNAGMATGVGVGTTSITATSETKTGSAVLTVRAAGPTLVRVLLTPDTIVILPSGTRQFTASGKMSDSSVATLTPPATFTATGGTIGASSGLYTAGVTPGTFRVIASASGKADTSTVTIVAPPPTPVATVTVAPPSATIQAGNTQQYTATLKDSLGNPLSATGRTITWGTSSGTIATVNGTGLVTGQSAGGPINVTATCETKVGTAQVTVTAAPPTLVRVILTPDTIIILTSATRQFTATGKFSDSSTAAVSATFTATGGTISAGGLYSSGTTAGTSFRVIASASGKADTSGVVIQERPVASVTLTPPTATISILGTQQFTATLRDALNNIVTSPTVSWSTGSTAIATVSVAGLAMGVAAGTTNVIAASGGHADTSSLTVSGTVAAIDTLFTDGFESGNISAWDDNYPGGANETHFVINDMTQARSGSRYLRITYPAGGDGGALSRSLPVGGPFGGYDHLYGRYWVKLPSTWQRGTKLIMFRGSRTDTPYSSFGVAGLCPNGTNFFATNVVTRDETALPLRFYSYYVGMHTESDGVTCYGRHGNNEDPGGAPTNPATYTAPLDLTKNVWHLIEFEVWLNTPGSSDGMQRFWLDGVLKGEWTGLNFRTSSILKLNWFTLEASMNAGGAASPVTQSISVDDVLITTGHP